MNLYVAPWFCLLASRMALYEGGQDAGIHEIGPSTKKNTSGSDFLQINPNGQVPMRDIGEGRVLSGYRSRVMQGPAVAHATLAEQALRQEAR